MEKKFRALFERGFTALDKTDEKTIFQWTAKIMYGIIYKELSLKIDRTKKASDTILLPEVLESYATLHLFLQSIRVKTEFLAPEPWSIFIFNYTDQTFNYTDDLVGLSFSMKLGRHGVTITFEDSSVIGQFLALLKKLETIPLNEVQFFEVTSQVFYAKRLTLNAPF